jgi:hypothetical protein
LGPNITVLPAVVKLVPVMATVVPPVAGPEVGLTPVTVGAGCGRSRMAWVMEYAVLPEVKAPVAVVAGSTLSHEANDGAVAVCFTRLVSAVLRTVGSVKLAPDDWVVARATSISLA